MVEMFFWITKGLLSTIVQQVGNSKGKIKNSKSVERSEEEC